MGFKKIDIAEKVTAMVIEKLEQGNIPWKQNYLGQGNPLPVNIQTKSVYSGINVLILGLLNPYPSRVWGTYKQWADKGFFVKKDEKGTKYIKFNISAMKDRNGNPIFDSKGREKVRSWTRIYNGFNACQTTATEEDISEFNELPKDVGSALEKYHKSGLSPKVNHAIGSTSCYAPLTDTITIQPKKDFFNEPAYLSELFHEHIHGTGHKSRLARFDHTQKNLKKTVEEYSFEELVAELGSAFLISYFNVGETEHNINQSAHYIESWLKKLKDNKDWVLKASAQAQKGMDFILK